MKKLLFLFCCLHLTVQSFAQTSDTSVVSSSTKNDGITRFLGGTIGAKFNQTKGSVSNTDNPAAVAPLGGVDRTIGSGYTISNPKNGLFVITFTKPFTQIFSVSANIIDTYGSKGAGVSNGTATNFSIPGTRLSTIESAQVSFLSNQAIQVTTGDHDGVLHNCSFSFLATGE